MFILKSLDLIDPCYILKHFACGKLTRSLHNGKAETIRINYV